MDIIEVVQWLQRLPRVLSQDRLRVAIAGLSVEAAVLACRELVEAGVLEGTA